MRHIVTARTLEITRQKAERIRELIAEHLGINKDEYVKRCEYLNSLKENSQ